MGSGNGNAENQKFERLVAENLKLLTYPGYPVNIAVAFRIDELRGGGITRATAVAAVNSCAAGPLPAVRAAVVQAASLRDPFSGPEAEKLLRGMAG